MKKCIPALNLGSKYASVETLALRAQLAAQDERMLENLRIQSAREDRFKEETLIIARKAQELQAQLAACQRTLEATQQASAGDETEKDELRRELATLEADRRRLREAAIEFREASDAFTAPARIYAGLSGGNFPRWEKAHHALAAALASKEPATPGDAK